MNMIRFRQAGIVSSVILAASAAALVAPPAGAQDFNARPNYGTVTLRTGYTPDPHTTAVRAGGNLDAQRVSSNCRGFISSAPDVRLVYTSGSLPLIISASSRADTTLVVNAPDGSWYCDDDGGVSGLNPAVRFNRPASGRYEIWVGTYGSGSLEPARLSISEVSSE
jgi:hypothetical protein